MRIAALACSLALLSLLGSPATAPPVTMGETPKPPAQPVPSVVPTATLAATMTIAPAASLPAATTSTGSSTASATGAAVAPLPTGSGHHLTGKLPTKATAEPTKPPPSSGDPFGAGRQ